MELSKRLQMNANLVPEHTKVADIGCDHGYVSLYLARHKHCEKVIAMDVNKGPLEIARKNILRANLSECIECRLSDGLSALKPGETDTVLIGGMGGMLVCKILKAYPEIMEHIRYLILQPQSDFREVRKTIHELGYAIREEDVCVDAGKFYQVIFAEKGEDETYTEAQLEFGKILPEKKHPVLQEHILSEKEKLEMICEDLQRKNTGNTLARIKEINHILELMSHTLKEYE